jgi:hypothetical protein
MDAGDDIQDKKWGVSVDWILASPYTCYLSIYGKCLLTTSFLLHLCPHLSLSLSLSLSLCLSLSFCLSPPPCPVTPLSTQKSSPSIKQSNSLLSTSCFIKQDPFILFFILFCFHSPLKEVAWSCNKHCFYLSYTKPHLFKVMQAFNTGASAGYLQQQRWRTKFITLRRNPEQLPQNWTSSNFLLAYIRCREGHCDIYICTYNVS